MRSCRPCSKKSTKNYSSHHSDIYLLPVPTLSRQYVYCWLPPKLEQVVARIFLLRNYIFLLVIASLIKRRHSEKCFVLEAAIYFLCVCVLLICARGRFPLRNAALSSGIAGLLLQPLSQQGEPDAGLGLPDKERGFNMAGKENQWDLRVEYGWGRRAHRRPCARPHTCTRVHTNVYTHSHVSMHTHASTQIIIIIITLAHAQAIIYSTTSNCICKRTPQDSSYSTPPLCYCLLATH